MKLASLRDGTRDGQLVVVTDDLSRYTPAGAVAGTLQAALDDWAAAGPGLEDLADRLVLGQIEGMEFDEEKCLSPLPRAYQWADGSAYVNHVQLVRQARGAVLPDSFWTDPLMYQGGSDSFIGPRAPIPLLNEAWGLDFEAEVAVVTDDVPMGVSEDAAGGHIKLIMLVNDISLRGLIPGELGKGFGFFQSKPSSAFSPVAVTPDALGEAWDGGKIKLPMRVDYNGEIFGRPRCDVDMTFEFPRLIAHAARTRPLAAGTIIGSGTVSNRDVDGGAGRPVTEGGVGYSCLAEIRMIETIADGKPSTPFMSVGDRVTIDMRDDTDNSIFGAIEQTVVDYAPEGAE